MTLRYTLLSDGSSDRVLMPIISWLLQAHGVGFELRGVWADLRSLRQPPTTLSGKVLRALEFYPCELLFVHRDAEGATSAQRRREIGQALNEIGHGEEVPVVSVIPVRMQEAWLLLDESAIRKAAGNPRGRVLLNLPAPNRIEDVPGPKEMLYRALRMASEQTGRRLRKLHVSYLRYRVVELIEDFSPLRTLPAFVEFENELAAIVQRLRPPQ
ncbi:MAG TPA: hypothetical protein VN948_20820 [Terriglobales bacterium]|nr:hypothetical protein [Terriglobales bacterium]